MVVADHKSMEENSVDGGVNMCWSRGVNTRQGGNFLSWLEFTRFVDCPCLHEVHGGAM